MNRLTGMLLTGLLLIVAAAIAGWSLYSQYREFLVTPLNLSEDGQVILVEQGDSLTAVLKKLETDGVTSLDWRWKLALRQNPVNVHVGEYLLDASLDPLRLLAKFDEGDVIQHRFTIIEGWSWRQLLEALKSDEVLLHNIEGFVDASEIESIAELIGASGIGHAEGWFLPETYYFIRGESDVDILERAHSAMKKALDEAWDSRDPAVPLESPYELLTLASIVEKETSLPEERSTISGVFARRLDQGMRLQTDPTVIYGLGASFDGDIRRRDLRTDTPYNTYTRHGLPPTPIAMPGKETLIATANPEDGTALFFVANGEGGHTFSDTLEEHEAAVRKLIERQ
jgi:UPF0755 protein